MWHTAQYKVLHRIYGSTFLLGNISEFWLYVLYIFRWLYVCDKHGENDTPQRKISGQALWSAPTIYSMGTGFSPGGNPGERLTHIYILVMKLKVNEIGTGTWLYLLHSCFTLGMRVGVLSTIPEAMFWRNIGCHYQTTKCHISADGNIFHSVSYFTW